MDGKGSSCDGRHSPGIGIPLGRTRTTIGPSKKLCGSASSELMLLEAPREPGPETSNSSELFEASKEFGVELITEVFVDGNLAA